MFFKAICRKFNVRLDELTITPHLKTKGECAFEVVAPILWNSPFGLMLCGCFRHFLKQLEANYF